MCWEPLSNKFDTDAGYKYLTSRTFYITTLQYPVSQSGLHVIS